MIVVLVFLLIVSVGEASANGYGNKDDQDALERFREYLEESGIGNFANYLEEMLSEWKSHSIHIGVTGRSGVGKSTFINTIRGLRATDSEAASAGVDETTKMIVSYPDKNNTKLIYWDLPGYGTATFPRDTYLKAVDFDKFDHLIILTADRFTDDDIWLVNQAKERRKPYFVVRNKIDAALENERHDYPAHSEEKVMEGIRNNLISLLGDPYLPAVYLISARFNRYNAWDFPKLITDLIQKGPRSKREAMVFSVMWNCRLVVAQKVQALRQRVWKIATLSAAVNIITFSGFHMAADIGLLERELKLYKKTLALDVKSLVSVANAQAVTIDDLRRYYETLDNKHYYEILFGRETTSFLITKLSGYAVSTVAKEALRYIPLVGPIVSSAASFSVTFTMLNDVLDDLQNAAVQLLHFIESRQSFN